jgi:hypothetical protein
MKYFLLPLLFLLSLKSFSQCGGEPILVNVTAVQDGCDYTVTFDMVIPQPNYIIDDFDLTATLQGSYMINSISPSFALSPNIQVNVAQIGSNTAGISIVNNNQGSTNMYTGSVVINLTTRFGCLELGVFSLGDCIEMGTVTGFGAGCEFEETANACLEINSPLDFGCERINIERDYGCFQLGNLALIGGSNCFPIFNDECFEVTMPDCSGCSPSAIDLFIIQDHILGRTPLDPSVLPFADVNCDGQVTAIDLINTQKFILNPFANPSDILNLPEGCPGPGQCVFIDESTGELITEVCSGQNLDVSFGVMGEVNGDCELCDDGTTIVPEEPNEEKFLSYKKSTNGTHLVFAKPTKFNTMMISLHLSVGNIDIDDIIFEESLALYVYQKEIINDVLYITLFNEETISVKTGQVIFSVGEEIDIALNNTVEYENILLGESIVYQNQLDENINKRSKSDEVAKYLSRPNHLLITNPYESKDIIVSIYSIDGRLQLRKSLINSNPSISLETPKRNELIIVTISSDNNVQSDIILH